MDIHPERVCATDVPGLLLLGLVAFPVHHAMNSFTERIVCVCVCVCVCVT